MLKSVSRSQVIYSSRSTSARLLKVAKSKITDNESLPSRTSIHTGRKQTNNNLLPIISNGIEWLLDTIAKLPIISEVVEAKKAKLQNQVNIHKAWLNNISVVPRASLGEIVKAALFPKGVIGVYFDVEGSTLHVADDKIEEVLNLSFQAQALILEAAKSLDLPVLKFPLEIATDGIMLIVPANVVALAKDGLTNLFDKSEFNLLGGFLDLEGKSALMAIEKETGQPQYFGIFNENGELERTLHNAEGLAKKDKTIFTKALKDQFVPFFDEYITSVTGGSLSNLNAYNSFYRFLEKKIPTPKRLQNPEPLRIERTVLSLREPNIVSDNSDKSVHVPSNDKSYSQRPKFETDFLEKCIQDHIDPITGKFLDLNDPEQLKIFYSAGWALNSKPSAYAFLLPTRDGSPITHQDVQLIYEIIDEVSCGNDMFPNASLLDNHINTGHHNLNAEVFDSHHAGFDGRRIKVCEGASFILTAPPKVIEMFCTRLAERAPHLLIPSSIRGRDSISLTTCFDKKGNPVHTCTDTVDREGRHPLRWSGYITAATRLKLKYILNMLLDLSKKLPTSVLEDLIPAYNYDKNPDEKLLINDLKSDINEDPNWGNLMVRLEKANPKHEKELKAFYKLFSLERLLKTESTSSSGDQSTGEISKQRELALKLREMDLTPEEYDSLNNHEPITKLFGDNLVIKPGTLKKIQGRYLEFSDYWKETNSDLLLGNMQDFSTWLQIEAGSILKITRAITNNFEADLNQHLIPKKLKTEDEKFKYQLSCLPVLLQKKVLDFCELTQFNLKNKNLEDILKHLKPGEETTLPFSPERSSENLLNQLKKKVQVQSPDNNKKNTSKEFLSSFSPPKNNESLITQMRTAQAGKLYSEIKKNILEEPFEIKVKDYKEYLKSKIEWLEEEIKNRKEAREENQAESSLLANELKGMKLTLRIIKDIAPDDDSGSLSSRIQELEKTYKQRKSLLLHNKYDDRKKELLENSLQKLDQKIKSAKELGRVLKKITNNLTDVNNLKMVDLLEKLKEAANQESLDLIYLNDTILSEVSEVKANLKSNYNG